MSSPEASVVAAIDFGTTFSGFAFAHKTKPSDIYSAFLWPETEGDQCKTNTQLYYSYTKERLTSQLALQSWGAKALIDYTQAEASSGELITNFKLHLAGNQYGPKSANPLPRALSTDQVITDYLRKISKFCMGHLIDTYGDDFSFQDVQFLLTVPAIWDDQAKQRMKACAEAAGLVQVRKSDGSRSAGSPHPLGIILEPEAAAVYCLSQPLLRSNKVTYEKGDKFLTADLGGGTVDLVIHEKVWKSSGELANLEIREVAKSSGGLCGSTYVDVEFMKHLTQRIPCFKSFVQGNPTTLLYILKWWEGIKKNFDGTLPQRWPTPATLAEDWKLDDQKAGRTPQPKYNVMEFTKEDLISIFEPVVKKVIEHIEEALSPFAPGEVKSIMAVGGFSSNRYLRKRLSETFKPRLVKAIVNPPDPSGAICKGAVMLGIAHKDLIVSRVSRKTYGQVIVRKWTAEDPVKLQFKDDDGVLKCDDCFQAFVREGEVVPSNHFVTREIRPTFHNLKTMRIQIFSCDGTANPQYVNEEGMVKEGEFVLDISSALEMDKDRKVAVTMYLGRSSIEVKAKGVNFEASGGTDKAIPVAFKADASPTPPR